MRIRLFYSLILLTVMVAGWGKTPAMTISPLNTITPISNNVIEKAQEWDLTTQDYQHYQWLMTNTPSSRWYKTLDPPEVLALNAKSQAQLIKYTQIVVKKTHQRVMQELAFNQMYGQVFRQMYPNERPIELKGHSSPSSISWKKGDRLWLFVKIQSSSQALVKTLLAFIDKHPDVILDIYVVGDNLQQDTIEAWAQKNQLPSKWMNRRITLNYGNFRWHQLKKHQSVILPFVIRLSKGHMLPVPLSYFL